MNRIVYAFAVAMLLLVSPRPGSAQLLAAKDGPVVYGHHHLSVTNIDQHKKFWVDTLGATITKVGTNNLEVVKVPNALILLRAQAPSGGSKGTTVDHIGFSVPDLRQVVDRVKKNGFRMVTQEEAPAAVPVKDDIGVVSAGDVTGIAYALGPDAVKIELIEMKKQAAPIVHHHVHFFGQQREPMRDWYVKVFGANSIPGELNGFIRAELPGVGLNFSPSAQPVVGTQGRVIDHIGFEVKNLEEFCKRLESQGIKLTRPYQKVAALNIAIAFITDPWGTVIELTEGFDKVQ